MVSANPTLNVQWNAAPSPSAGAYAASREAGASWGNPAARGTLAGSGAGGGVGGVDLNRIDPSKLGQLFPACATGELGEAAVGAGQTATKSQNQLQPLHPGCPLQTQQTTLTPLPIDGITTLVPVVTPGPLMSNGGGPGGPPRAKTGRDIIEETARGVAARGWAYLKSRMSEEMLEALRRTRGRLNYAFAGSVVHDETDSILRGEYGRRFRYQRSSEVDFVDTLNGLDQEIELATAKGKARHWAFQRFWHPNVQYATYDLPPDIPPPDIP